MLACRQRRRSYFLVQVVRKTNANGLNQVIIKQSLVVWNRWNFGHGTLRGIRLSNQSEDSSLSDRNCPSVLLARVSITNDAKIYSAISHSSSAFIFGVSLLTSTWHSLVVSHSTYSTAMIP